MSSVLTLFLLTVKVSNIWVKLHVTLYLTGLLDNTFWRADIWDRWELTWARKLRGQKEVTQTSQIGQIVEAIKWDVTEKFTSCASSIGIVVQHLCWWERSNWVCAAFKDLISWLFNLCSSPSWSVKQPLDSSFSESLLSPSGPTGKLLDQGREIK